MLSFDIQVEIIKKLPIKSLIQFRSVCKAWKALIDSPHFIAGYNSGQPQHLMISYSVGFREVKYVYDKRKIESINSIPCQVMVFMLSSGEWTCLCSNLPRKSIGFTCCRAVIGQFIYWLAYDRTVVDGECRNLIMSFDMNTEEFREIDLPDSLAKLPKSNLSISRLRESLAVVEYGGVFEDLTWKRVCSVWMMDHGDFTKLFTINLPNASVLWTLGFRKSGEPIVEMQNGKDYHAPCALAVYEPFSKHIKDLGILGDEFSFFGSFYTESLLLLDHEDGHIVRCGSVKS